MKEYKYEPEIWVDLKDDKLKGTEHKYSISSYGRVWNKQDECFVSPVMTGKPTYWYVNLCIDKTRKLRRIHYLQAYSFFGKPPKDTAGSVKRQTCDHIDRNRYNNSLYNLRWLDRKGQSANRDCTVNWEGVPVADLLRKDYSGLATMDFDSCKAFITKRVKVNKNTYEEAKELYSQREEIPYGRLIKFKGVAIYLHNLSKVFKIPYTQITKFISDGYSLEELFPKFTIKHIDTSLSIEANGKWYPTKKSFCDEIGISCRTLSNRLGLVDTIDEVESYDVKDKNRVYVGEHFMSVPEHCTRLQVSYGRVTTYMYNKGMSLEKALTKASTPTRIIKHKVTGVHSVYGEFHNNVRRNKEWCIMFGLDPRYVSSRMAKGYTMTEVLTYKGVNLESLVITPYTK